MKRINVLIAGAQKAGSSSLKDCLAQHPEICVHKRLEFGYFMDELDYKEGLASTMQRYFSHYKQEDILMAKTVTALTSKKTVERICRHNKDMKIIFVLRNPIERAYSAFWYSKSQSWEEATSFKEALGNTQFKSQVHKNSTDYLYMSNYKEHLDNLFSYFNRDQVKLILFDDLKQDMHSVCEDIFSFLDIDQSFLPEIIIKNKTKASRLHFIDKLLNSQLPFKRFLRKYVIGNSASIFIKEKAESLNRKSFVKPKIDLNTKDELQKYFLPMIEELESLYSLDLSSWRD